MGSDTRRIRVASRGHYNAVSTCFSYWADIGDITYQGNIGDELGSRGGGEVDAGAVLGGGLVAEQVDVGLLEELVAAELEGTLEEVTGGRGAEAGQERAGTLLLDDLAEATDEAAVVGDRVELDTGFDAVQRYLSVTLLRLFLLVADVVLVVRENWRDLHIDGGETSVGDGTADGSGECESRIQVQAA